jgi:hypothetical protein
MLVAELWRPLEARDGELLCTGCMTPGAAPSQEQDTEGVLF